MRKQPRTRALRKVCWRASWVQVKSVAVIREPLLPSPLQLLLSFVQLLCTELGHNQATENFRKTPRGAVLIYKLKYIL